MKPTQKVDSLSLLCLSIVMILICTCYTHDWLRSLPWPGRSYASYFWMYLGSWAPMALFVFQSIGAAWKRTDEKEKKKVPSTFRSGTAFAETWNNRVVWGEMDREGVAVLPLATLIRIHRFSWLRCPFDGGEMRQFNQRIILQLRRISLITEHRIDWE